MSTELKVYEVLSPVMYKGKIYKIGDLLECIPNEVISVNHAVKLSVEFNEPDTKSDSLEQTNVYSVDEKQETKKQNKKVKA